MVAGVERGRRRDHRRAPRQGRRRRLDRLHRRRARPSRWRRPRPRARASALVVGTTGLGTHARAALDVAALKIPVVYAANYSVGINVMLKLVADAARALGPDYDIEIVETHHRAKKDAPSGTALRWRSRWPRRPAATWPPPPATPATATSARAAPSEIGIQTLRGGDVVGDHTVLLPGQRRSHRDHPPREHPRHLRRRRRARRAVGGRLPARPLRHAQRARPRGLSLPPTPGGGP